MLIAGDIVQDKIIPNMPNDEASRDHGAIGDGSLIAKERAFFVDVQKRSLELRREAGRRQQDRDRRDENEYPDWAAMGPVANREVSLRREQVTHAWFGSLLTCWPIADGLFRLPRIGPPRPSRISPRFCSFSQSVSGQIFDNHRRVDPPLPSSFFIAS